MTNPRRLLFVWTAAALAAACARDEPARPAAAARSGPLAPAPEAPNLTPAESAAAVAAQRSDARAATRAVRANVGALDPPPPAAPHVETPHGVYESCLAQARSLEGPERSRILEICERGRPGP